MIFVTVGTQLPFDRLVRAVDELQPELQERVVAQVGRHACEAENLIVISRLTPLEFERHIDTCRVVVAHAGIGTIIAAARHRRPLIVFPREARYGEHRNDHQLATCEHLAGRPGIYVARDVDHLRQLLRSDLSVADTKCSQANSDAFVRSFNSMLLGL